MHPQIHAVCMGWQGAPGPPKLPKLLGRALCVERVWGRIGGTPSLGAWTPRSVGVGGGRTPKAVPGTNFPTTPGGVSQSAEGAGWDWARGIRARGVRPAYLGRSYSAVTAWGPGGSDGDTPVAPDPGCCTWSARPVGPRPEPGGARGTGWSRGLGSPRLPSPVPSPETRGRPGVPAACTPHASTLPIPPVPGEPSGLLGPSLHPGVPLPRRCHHSAKSVPGLLALLLARTGWKGPALPLSEWAQGKAGLKG